MLDGLITMVLSLIGLIFLIPLYIVSAIIEFISFGTIDKDTAGKWIIILLVLYVIFKIIKYIYTKIICKKEIKQIKVAEKYTGGFNFNKYEIDLFTGTVSERGDYIKTQTNKINKIFNENVDFVYENNKFIYKPLINKDMPYLPVSRKDIEFLNNHLPIKYDEIPKIKEKYNKLISNIEEDLSESFKQFSIYNKGVIGEENVEKQMALYGDRYKVLTNIRVELNGQSSESDMIIVCEKGVFVIETKNYGKKGQTLKIKADGMWFLNQNPLNDVNSQNNYHCAINQSIINDKLKLNGYMGKFIDCQSIICIANNDVLIDNESNQVIVRVSNIITEIKSFNTNDYLSEEIQEQIIEILKESNLPENLYSVEGRASRIEKNFEELKDLIPYISDIYDIIYDFKKKRSI